MQVIMYIGIFCFLLLSNSPLHGYTVIYNSKTNAYLSSFQFGVIINNATEDIQVQIVEQRCLHFSWMNMRKETGGS